MRRFLAILLLPVFSTICHADNWPAWRGPTGQGHSAEKNVPWKWSDKENVKWKVKLANPGNSTPVVWENKIFLTQANKDGTVRSLLCFDRSKEGKLLWQKDVEYPHQEKNWGGITYTNASPAVDSKRVVVSFASAGMYCYDHNGNELWKRDDLGHWEHVFGNGSSPVLYQNLAILWVGPDSLPPRDEKKDEKNKDPKASKGKAKKGGARNFLIAVDRDTGKTVWEAEEKYGSWSTPLIVNVKGQDQLLLSFGPDAKNKPNPPSNLFKGYDPRTGKEIWHAYGLNSFVYTSPLYANGVAVSMSGYGGSAIAVKLGGTGDITENRLWIHPKNIQRVGSGVIVGDHVYIVDENGMPRCYELMTGNEVWQVEDRPSDMTWGSLVHADGKLYILMRDGETIVMKASPKFEILATNSLGKREQTNSSIAISNGEVYVRTFQHLWCIADKK